MATPFRNGWKGALGKVIQRGNDVNGMRNKNNKLLPMRADSVLPSQFCHSMPMISKTTIDRVVPTLKSVDRSLSTRSRRQNTEEPAETVISCEPSAWGRRTLELSPASASLRGLGSSLVCLWIVYSSKATGMLNATRPVWIRSGGCQLFLRSTYLCIL